MSIFSQFGVRTIINASGPVTRLSGAILSDAVRESMRQAGRDSVNMEELQAAASRRIAEVTGAGAGLVTAGASAALTLGTAAILCKNDVARMARLPDTTGFPNEFLIARDQRNGYDRAAALAGAKLVDVGHSDWLSGAGVRGVEPADYEQAISPATAGILYVLREGASPTLAELVPLARRHHLPILVDAAASLPPRSNLRDLASRGASLVTFSGGKAIGGPQNTGILCGERSLVQSAAVQMLDMDEHPTLWSPPEDFIDRKLFPAPPRQGIGRGFKVAKEQVIGLLVALEHFANGPSGEFVGEISRRLEAMARPLRAADIECRIVMPATNEKSPWLELILKDQDAFDVCRRLRAGEPPIFVGHGRLREGVLVVCLDAVRPDHDEAMTSRFLAELGGKRSSTRT